MATTREVPPSDTKNELTEVRYGTQNVLDTELQFFSKSKTRIDTCMNYTRPQLAIEIEQIKRAFIDSKNRGVRLRYTTEITAEECLPQEYKRKYTTNKSEVSSLSKQGNSTTNEQAQKELEQSLIRRKKAIVTADQISANETEFRIPKDKYPQLKAAMDNSINSVYVMFDKSGVLERAEPDTFRT